MQTNDLIINELIFMEQQFMKTAFFDFDGVVVDTEPIYDIYWNEAGERYQTGIPNFAFLRPV